MAHKERINPRTGKKEYKYRYYFIADGKKRDSETAWFDSLEKAKKEAEEQKAKKEKADRNKVTQRRDKKLVSAFEEYVEYLKVIADKEIVTSDKSYYSVANNIYNNHMPLIIQETRIKDLSIFTFRSWLTHMNAKESIGGLYIRACRQCLLKFNVWLSNNGYYLDEYQEETFEIGIRRTKIKSSKENNRERKGDRHVLSILEIQDITRYYTRKEYGLGEFRNFYYYTLFLVLFYSGMRVGELVSLQWKFIDLREGARTITIKNSINQLESVGHAVDRVEKGKYRTKNQMSIRRIPIFDFYYELLIDYKESYMYEYGINKEEIEECFVFPNLSKHDPKRYVRSKTVLSELKRVINALNIENTDLQMFRHSCATFLILPPPDGLGYTEEKVKDYFGHQDTAMLTKIYARLSQEQKADRMRHTFKEIYNPDETKERTIEEEMKEKLLKRISGDNEREKRKAREYRIHNQIKKAIKQKRKVYCYLEKDKDIISSYIEKNGSEIKFEMMEG